MQQKQEHEKMRCVPHYCVFPGLPMGSYGPPGIHTPEPLPGRGLYQNQIQIAAGRLCEDQASETPSFSPVQASRRPPTLLATRLSKAFQLVSAIGQLRVVGMGNGSCGFETGALVGPNLCALFLEPLLHLDDPLVFEV